MLVEKPFAASIAKPTDDCRHGRRDASSPSTGRSPGILAQHREAADRRGRDRRSDRGALLRRQSRPTVSSRRQDRSVARGGGSAEADLLVVQEGRGRRQPARLSRLRRDARHLVHAGRGADRGDQRRRRDAGHRGGPALDHRLPLSARACPSSRPAGARFSDPWTQQPQPKCGFVLVGSRRHASRATTTTTTSPSRRGRSPR